MSIYSSNTTSTITIYNTYTIELTNNLSFLTFLFFLQQYGPFLVLVPPEKLAIITLSTALNCVLRTGNLGEKLVRVAFEIASTVEAEVHLLNIKQDQHLPTWQKRVASTEKPTNTRSLSAFNMKLRKVVKKEEWSPSDKVNQNSFFYFQFLYALYIYVLYTVYIYDMYIIFLLI